jgi:hypothetical protein
MVPRAVICWALALFLSGLATAQDAPAPNRWVKLGKAVIEGRRWDVPVGYSPELKRFLVLGGRITYADARKPRSYDQLALDPKEGRWENWFPTGKDWGPRFGLCQPPTWKNELWHFQDAEGNVRPNWSVYGTFSLGGKYDRDPTTGAFVFYARGRTFRYDPAARRWAELTTKTDPEKELGGTLLWSSMCYDRHGKRFVLFGGGNVQTPRGDPGTWTFTPASSTWASLALDHQPPQRANSRLCSDPVHRKVILFGGDRLDQLLSDTWTFDVVAQKWELKKPVRGPSPRAGHALLWLPRAKKVLLLGGYGYASPVGYVESPYRRLPLEAWTYEAGAARWDLVRRWEGKDVPQGPPNAFLGAAVDEEDNVLVAGTNGTWTCRLEVNKPDAASTARHGVSPGTVERRTGPYDPAWYRQDVPAAEAATVEAELKALPANRWVRRPTPKLPRPNMDWGSAVFAPELDVIVRFSGGHSAYSGTAPQVYDVKTDRYSIPFAPELPIEYVYSNDQVHGEWSFQGNPWMTGHTYKSTGYDPHLKCLVFAAHEYTYFFDPRAGKWSRNEARAPFRPNMYVVTLCATPDGVAAWADDRKGAAGLWRLDARSRTWKALPLKGALPAKGPDQHGLAYDSRRDRLLFFSNAGKNRGDVAAYDFRSGEARWLDPAGKARAAVPSRETAYIPELDAVLIGARVSEGGKRLWALYDCGKNGWCGVDLPGDDPIGKGTGGSAFNNSVGLMHDPNRKLVWAVGQNSHVHVLRLERGSASVHELR